ncbi:LysR family transcriptional regulator [Herbaspirillum lusitanum]|uniref:LysR family transcriptional regulator n=1 Tax=Herbaspirillum lusitanum TaxID=213312 RepID=UPI002238330D|nr:LysR family transcriptional regulator [Herbaspirillum lusitanum]MCW5297791.1 LysR family transcriptional regulator [Herbaspirillum lusitanum]
MTLTQLRYVLAVIDHGGISRAAEHCEVTQPTMSAQIKKLEDELAVPLFERIGSGVHVTPIGLQIAQYARGLLELAQAIKSVSRDSGGLPGGSLRLGVVPSAAPALLKTAIRAVREKFTEMKIDVREGSASDLFAQLKNCEIDLIIGPAPAEDLGLRWLPLFWEPYIVCGQVPKGAKAPVRHNVSEVDVPSYILDEGGAVDTYAYGGTTSLRVSLQDHIGWKSDTVPYVASIATLHALLSSSNCVVIAPLTATPMIAGTGGFQERLGTPNVGRTLGFVWRTSYPWTTRCYEIYDMVYANLPDGVVALEKFDREQITLGIQVHNAVEVQRTKRTKKSEHPA